MLVKFSQRGANKKFILLIEEYQQFNMVDVARQLLDELMGRNRNLDPSASAKEVSWTDEEVGDTKNV